jgi:hypothetical protein
MKSISSAIVVGAGIYAITHAVPLLTTTHPGFVLLALVAGIITLALGLVGWWASLKYDR